MIYLIADSHFSHKNIIKYCNRPFSTVEEMNETIVSNWNKLVTPDDIVYHLGDVAFGNTGLECARRCVGHKHLILGNHDRGFSKTKFKLAGFESINLGPYYLKVDNTTYMLNHMYPDFIGQEFISFCGHAHDTWKFKHHYLNVGVDQWNFTPVPLNEAISVLKQHKENEP